MTEEHLLKLIGQRSRSDGEVRELLGRDLMASEQRSLNRLLETRSQLGDEIGDAIAAVEVPGKTMEYVRNNWTARQAKIEELRALDSKSSGRSWTDSEQARAEELRTEVEEFDSRISSLLGQAVRGEKNREATNALLGNLLDTRGGSGAVRQPGPAGFEFRSEDIAGAFEALHRGQVAKLECRAVSAYPVDRQQSAVGVVTRRVEPTRLLSLMPTQQVETATATYWSAVATGGAGATAAATVAPGALKPESTPGWVEQTATIRKIAHWSGIPKEGLDDYPSFQQIVSDEMVNGLINVENAQLISGDGTGTNLLGLLNQTGIQSYAPAGAEARAKSILHAITMVRTGSGFLDADTVVAHPSDWETIQNWASTTGELIVSDPGQATARNLWGVNLVITTGITAGTGLVANLAASTVVFTREAPNVMVDPYSDSIHNLVRFIAEERLGLGVIRPAGLVKITYNGTA